MSDYREPARRASIKAWAEEDRPREKLLHKGRHALSDAELLAILIGSGNAEESAVALAQRILHSVDHNLYELGRRALDELMQFKGIGQAKAITIAAALELGRRRQLAELPRRPAITSSAEAHAAIAPLLSDLGHEEFWILLLNKANRLIGRERISSGGTAGTVVDAGIVFRKAILAGASALILAHNHPSGNLTPSDADIRLTRKLVEAGRLLDMPVLDHLIIAAHRYYSFADEGRMR